MEGFYRVEDHRSAEDNGESHIQQLGPEDSEKYNDPDESKNSFGLGILCLHRFPDPKPPHGADFSKLDLLEIWRKVPPDTWLEGNAEARNIESLTTQDLKSVNAFAAAFRREPPDFAQVEKVFDKYRCDPEHLRRLLLSMQLTLPHKWSIADTTVDQDGQLQVDIYKACVIHDVGPPTYFPHSVFFDSQPSFTFKTLNKCEIA
jgi:hypothetical protein